MDATFERTFDETMILAAARRVVSVEIEGLLSLKARLDGEFVEACGLILKCSGRVVVTGMGKSGHVGRKIASTLASTGTPAFFVHPAEGAHGDIGMIAANDVLLAISNSGETDELLAIVPSIRRKGVPIVAIIGRRGSSLASYASVALDASVSQEACPLNLAPTASTTVTLALGDALAVALLEIRGFTAEDFARSHPAGSLGRRLLLRVADVMRTGEAVPVIGPSASLRDGLLEMTKKCLGMVAIIEGAHRVLGVLTDGDLRRALDASLDLSRTLMADVMNRRPKCIYADALAVDAVRQIERHRVSALLVLDGRDVLVGALNVHDLLSAKVV